MKKLITLLSACVLLSVMTFAQTCPSTTGSGGSSSVRWLNSGLLTINWGTSPDATTMYNALVTTGTAITLSGTVSGGTNDGMAFSLSGTAADFTNPTGTRIRPASSASGNNGESAQFTGTVTFNLAAGGSMTCDYIAGVYQAPLPVELLDFKAENNTVGIALNWKTSSEFDNDYFSIERSNDGSTFREIGMMPGQGASLEVWDYEYNDDAPDTGRNYYRLKQVDFNGAANFSKIIAINFRNENQGADLVAFPTVLKDNASLTLDLSQFDQRLIEVHIFDPMGRKVYSTQLRGGVSHLLDLNQLPNNSYILSTTDLDQVLSTRFIISK